MEIQIKFNSILAEKIGKTQVVHTDKNELTVSQFISIIENQVWAHEVIENRHVKHPVVLIIDNNLIQNSNLNHTIRVTENSDVVFQIMFAGG